MIITIGGIKGGSGKSTIATNLAVMMNALLLDADDQETAWDFSQARQQHTHLPPLTAIKATGASVRSQAIKLASEYPHIIIDTGGRDTTSQRAALTVSDIALFPFAPRSFDIWTLDKLALLLADIRQVNPTLQAVAFINRADTQGQDNLDAASAIKETEGLLYIDTPIHNRKAFANAAAQGLCVTELKPKASKAIDEMTALLTTLTRSYKNLHKKPRKA